jgi:hypothetical protein
MAQSGHKADLSPCLLMVQMAITDPEALCLGDSPT